MQTTLTNINGRGKRVVKEPSEVIHGFNIDSGRTDYIFIDDPQTDEDAENRTPTKGVIKFKRSSCAVLPLVLERVWFEKIKSGEKYEEYRCGSRMMRMIQRWWGEAKIEHKKAIVEFRLGYQRDAERLACVAKRVSLRAEGEFIHPDLGEPTDRKHYAILLTGSVELINDEWRARA